MEFSTLLFYVVGQKMLSWIDRRCQQGTGKFNLPFAGISVILVRDMLNYLLLWTKCYITKDLTKKVKPQGFVIYQVFDKVVNLTKNERSKSKNDEHKRFQQLLLNLQSGNSTGSDWNLLQSRTPDSVGNKKDVKKYVKLSFSNEK